MGFEKPLTGAQRVAKRRAALRAQGLRPRTFWLPDPRSEGFQKKAEASCRWLWEQMPEDAEALAWAEAITCEVLADLDAAEEEYRRKHEA